MSREEFLGVVTAEQPDTPSYFAYDAVLNARERPTLEQALSHGVKPLSLDEALAVEGVQILDTRDPADFAGAHLVGSVNIGLGGSYATWAGTVLDRDRPIVLIADPGHEPEAALRLGRIGFDGVAGYVDGGMKALAGRPDLVDRLERITAATLAEQLRDPDAPILVDVRTEPEWRENRIEGSLNVPLSRLLERVAEVPHERRLVLYCTSGYRSSIAASLLHRRGVEDVIDLVGGMGAWAAFASNGGTVAPLPSPATAAQKDPALLVWTQEPLNAETPLELLCRETITPTGLFFVRTHGSVPEVDPATYRLTVGGLVREPRSLSLGDLRRFERVEVTAALQCAGNRRSELAAVSPIPGQVPWGAGAIGNAVWGGVRLRDVLEAAGLEVVSGHVAFTGLDEVEGEGRVLEFGTRSPSGRPCCRTS
jgi:rhodanese-related sulfurtransferase